MPSEPSNVLVPRRSAYLFTGLIAAAFALLIVRLPLVNLPALWIDEAFSLYHARLSLAQLWGEGWRLESSPPLYYTALWGWIRLTSDSEASSRLFSLLLSGVAAYFVYRAARRLSGPLAGAMAAVAWLLPALGLEFSLEIRPYALQQCWIAMALSAFVSATRAWSAGHWRRNDFLWRILPMVLAAVAAFYTHTTSMAFIGALAVAGLYFGWAMRAGRPYWLTWAATAALTALLCLPQILAAAQVLATNRAGLAWIPSSLDLRVLSQVVRQWALGTLPWSYPYSAPLAGLVFAVLASGAWRLRKRADVTAIGGVMGLAGALLLVLAGLVQSVLLTRTALWLWVPMAILLGCAIVTVDWRNPWRWPVAAALLGVFFSTNLAYVGGRAEQRPWRNSILMIAERARPGDRILVIDPEVACVLDHYAEGLLRTMPRARLELGREQRFRSRQRLDIVCNHLSSVELPAVAIMPAAGDWILTDGEQQRADLVALLQRTTGWLRTTDVIKGAGQVQATRVVRFNAP